MRAEGKGRKVKGERPVHLWLFAFAFCLSAVFSFGCGRKAVLRAPEEVLPQTIGDLTASDMVDGIQLAWSRPRTYVNGGRMTDLSGFVIERATTSDPRPAFARINVLEVTDRDRFRQVKHFRYLDRETKVGTQYSYRVVSFTVDRYFSAPSNVVTLERTMIEGTGNGSRSDG